MTARRLPHTRLGKHLRFSHADLVVIATTAAQPAGIPVAARRPDGVVDPAPPAGGEPDAAQVVPLRAQTSVHIRYRHPPAAGGAAVILVGVMEGR